MKQAQRLLEAMFPEENRLSKLDPNSATWKAIKRENPVTRQKGPVTIYRATVGSSIRSGDFVALNKDVAEMALENLRDRGENGQILSKQVDVSDLLMANDATEFIYDPV